MTEKPPVRRSLRALRSAQKSNRGAPLYSRLVNRPMGRLLAAVSHRLGLTPDQVTMISALLTFSGVASVAMWRPSATMAVTTTLLLVLGYGLDAADGQLARLRGGGSPAGEWLDHFLDCIKLNTLHLAVLISMYRFGDLPSESLLLIPLAFSAVAAVHFFGFVLTDKLKWPEGRPLAQVDVGRPSLARSVLAAPTDYGLLCLAFLTFPWTPVFLVVYSLLMIGSAGYLLLAAPKWYLDVRRLPGAPTDQNPALTSAS